MRTYYLYALIDPNSNKPKYIGTAYGYIWKYVQAV